MELLFAAVILLNSYGNGTTITLEAEEGTSTGCTVPRSAASNEHTVRLEQSQYIINTFTTSCNCTIRFTNIVYTNDGDSDTITVSLDGEVVGMFYTHSRTSYGNLWNDPNNSGRIGEAIELEPGMHQVRIEASTTDRYLVEIDRVIVTVDCSVNSSVCLNILPQYTEPCSDNTTTSLSTEALIAIISCVVGFLACLIGVPTCIITSYKLRNKCCN